MSDVTRVEAIYLAAIEREDPREQAAYLESACGGDAEIRQKVDELLAAHPKVGRFLEPPADGTHGYSPGADPEPVVVIAGTLIAGRYKLLERIGEGGMGEVWVAEQTAPVKRKVAIKLIKVGMDSRAVLARFEAERQALAVMDHPNIAKVLDGGLHDGKPYFVMELVKGVPITDFCDARKLTPKERLELFLPVCQAIQHAHQKGVIHRDIKPSNVLVALYDDRPVPKVIDFGVAKAAGQTLTDLTLHTGYGTVVGTPEYMSPEQASFNNLDIDTRSDVYSLGVLLYELLTGTTPVDRKSLKEAALLEVLRIVREVDVPRPSQKLSTNATLASIAANRGMEPTKLPRLMRGELDWILLKALEKDRGRRYESANGLAADVGRYLSGEAVNACPPTLGYRLRKAYRRNRAAVWVGLMFTLMLLSGAAVASVLAIQARRAETMAEARQQEAQHQAENAVRSNEALVNMSWNYKDLAADAGIQSASARLDADLLEYKADSRHGLLRLARPLKSTVGPLPIRIPNASGITTVDFQNNPEFVVLREFQTAAVIAAGQEFVPLLPPLEGAYTLETSPDGRLLLAGEERTGIELVAIPSLKRIGVLREGTERLVKWGFSPDSKTIWTQDTDSVVRFWNTDGTFRAKAPLRPERFVYPAGMTIEEVRRVAERGNAVLVTDSVAVIQSLPPVVGKAGKHPNDWRGIQTQVPGPTDIFSTRTGQFIRRLDRPGWKVADFRLAASGRWLLYQEAKDQVTEVVIVSAEDGRELARLQHPGTKPDLLVIVSPSGKWLLTTCTSKNEAFRPDQSKLWRSSDWQQVEESSLQAVAISKNAGSKFPDFVSDDTLVFVHHEGVGLLQLGQQVQVFPPRHLGLEGDWYANRFWLRSELGGSIIRCGRVLTDANTFQRLKPPPGRKYAPELAKLAPDGRFFENLDTVREKELPYFRTGAFYPGFGHVGIRTYGEAREDEPRYYDDSELRILPDTSKLNIPPAMLELWAQVVTGGELGDDGRFMAWDEPTWLAKQKQLAAMPVPYPDFPFPGWAATEPNLWWRIRANMTQNSPEREKLLGEWRRRTGRIHPNSVRDTWRTPGPAAELAPLPRSAATGAK